MTRISIRLLTVTYTLSIALLVALAIVSIYNQVPIAVLTRDPTVVGNVHPFTGVLSNLGVLLWCSSAAICLFSGVVLLHTPRTKGGWFLICSALLTLGLLFDDFFLFHEYLAQHYLGISEKAVYVFEMGVTAAYLLIFRRVILQSEYAVLYLALVFFAISVVIDVRFTKWLGAWIFLVEDGAKFLGLVSWCNYYARVSYQFLANCSGVLPNASMSRALKRAAHAGVREIFTQMSPFPGRGRSSSSP
jgi:hypothetical protein